jgi:hypothetical protein
MVNAWKGRIKEFVVQNCHVCLTGARETVLHQLWECKSAHDAWARGSHVIDRVVPRLDTRAPPPPPLWKCMQDTSSSKDSTSEEQVGDPLRLARSPLPGSMGCFAHRIPKRYKQVNWI